MKVLWFTNVVFPELGKLLNRKYSYSGGWMHKFRDQIQSDNNQLAIVTFEFMKKSVLIEEEIGKVKYFIIPKKQKNINKYDKSIEKYIETVMNFYQPEIVHIWGTEYPHSLAVTKICREKNLNFVISIQGVINDIARHYTQGLPTKTVYNLTLRDFIRKDNVYMQKKNFLSRGKFEIETIKLAKNIIGRTDYDYSCIKSVNPNVAYHFCNECLRDCFYEGKKWDIEKIERLSIFISQAYYPIKGFHYFLEALPIIKSKFSNVKVYVGGGMNIFPKTVNDKFKQESYTKYLREKIEKYNLSDSLIFLDSLNSNQMKERMLSSHVFVSPSLIENSSNSIGEAMILGVPIVSSYVGGVSSMLKHKESGLLYPVDQPNMLAEYIIEIFKNDKYANKLSENAKKNAKKLFDLSNNTKNLMEIYYSIKN